MASFTCCICKRDFSSIRGLHGHLSKTENIKAEHYYHLYYPRTDLLTNQLLEYKDYEQYFTSFFNSKENLNYWFKENYKTDKAKEVAKTIVSTRAKRKKLKFAPTQVELRTANSPSIIGVEKMFDYNEFCRSVDLIPRFNYKDIKILPQKELEILVDTREQKPLPFTKARKAKLDVGDYTAAEPNYADIFIERKSIEDFFGTFSQENNIKRFEKEAGRALEMGMHLIVVVESTLNTCLEYKPYTIKDHKFALATFGNVRDFLETYPNLQFVFCYNRYTAQQLILTILSQGDAARKIDWQFVIDSKIL